jgi:hypothetical protein
MFFEQFFVCNYMFIQTVFDTSDTFQNFSTVFHGKILKFP